MLSELTRSSELMGLRLHPLFSDRPPSGPVRSFHSVTFPCAAFLLLSFSHSLRPSSSLFLISFSFPFLCPRKVSPPRDLYDFLHFRTRALSLNSEHGHAENRSTAQWPRILRRLEKNPIRVARSPYPTLLPLSTLPFFTSSVRVQSALLFSCLTEKARPLL